MRNSDHLSHFSGTPCIFIDYCHKSLYSPLTTRTSGWISLTCLRRAFLVLKSPGHHLQFMKKLSRFSVLTRNAYMQVMAIYNCKIISELFMSRWKGSLNVNGVQEISILEKLDVGTLEKFIRMFGLSRENIMIYDNNQ
jgi:hypothetical protein